MKLATLTDVTGHTVHIAPSWVQAVRHPIPSDHPDTNCVLYLSGREVSVKEKLGEVVQALKELG